MGGKKLRRCGECIACCVHLPFDQVGVVNAKAGHVRCNKLQAGCNGCSIYDTRPQFCRDYACQWSLRDKILDFRMCPDKCKILVHMKRDELGGRPGLAITETAPGAFHQEANKKATRQFMLQKKWSSVVLVAYSGEELVYSNNQAHLEQLGDHFSVDGPISKRGLG